MTAAQLQVVETLVTVNKNLVPFRTAFTRTVILNLLMKFNSVE